MGAGSIRSSDWLFMKKLNANVQVELTRSHTKRAVMILARWLTSYEMLQAYEDEIIMQGDASFTEKNYFRGCLAHVKGNGIMLLDLLENLPEDTPQKHTGISCKDVNAMIEELTLRESVYDTEKLPEQCEDKLKELFGDSPKRH